MPSYKNLFNFQKNFIVLARNIAFTSFQHSAVDKKINFLLANSQKQTNFIVP